MDGLTSADQKPIPEEKADELFECFITYLLAIIKLKNK